MVSLGEVQVGRLGGAHVDRARIVLVAEPLHVLCENIAALVAQELELGLTLLKSEGLEVEEIVLGGQRDGGGRLYRLARGHLLGLRLGGSLSSHARVVRGELLGRHVLLGLAAALLLRGRDALGLRVGITLRGRGLCNRLLSLRLRGGRVREALLVGRNDLLARGRGHETLLLERRGRLHPDGSRDLGALWERSADGGADLLSKEEPVRLRRVGVALALSLLGRARSLLCRLLRAGGRRGHGGRRGALIAGRLGDVGDEFHLLPEGERGDKCLHGGERSRHLRTFKRQ